MCGIAGIVHFQNKLTDHDIRSFTDSMAHRGPDGAGYELFESDNLALGHRRLSILDLSEAGKQPMSYAGGRYWISYNGEVYNFLELRSELTALNFQFKTQTDTEVILAAYHHWGKKCFSKFNGMWAIAIFDTHQRHLLLCRDRYGVKPLHYIHENDVFAFASETIAFKYLKAYHRSIDEANFSSNCLQYNYTEAENKTFYKDIFQIPAGAYAIFNLQNKKLNIEKWWDQKQQIEEVPSSYTEQVEKFKYLFFDAIKLRLRSDVNIASALSGGIDSSSIFCSIEDLSKNCNNSIRLPGDWQSAFVNTFPGTSFDERKYAEIVEKHTGKKVHYVSANSDNLVDDVIKSTQLFDAISGTAINCVTDVYKAMYDNSIRVSLDGHGADELMFGYTESARMAYIDSILFRDDNQDDLAEVYTNMYEPIKRVEVLERLKAQGRQLLNAKIQSENRFFLKKYLSQIKQVITKQEQTLTYDDWFTKPYTNKSNAIFDFYNRNAVVKNWNDFLITDIPYNLRDFDRGSMQHSMEIRMPFMDYRLVNYCFSLPTDAKIGRGYTKRVLRDAMKDILPEAIRTRTYKQGLSAPMANWFNHHLNDFIQDEVRSQSFLSSSFWNGKLVSDFALEKCKLKIWDTESANRFWLILNAHIIINK